MTEPYHSELDQIIRRALQRRAAVIDARLRDLAPGQTLCVHDLPNSGDAHVVVLAGQLHVLATGEECDNPVRRVQYGPAPADWRAVVDAER